MHHLTHLSQVLTLLKESRVALKLKKCSILADKDYLRQVIHPGKIGRCKHNIFGHQETKGPRQINGNPAFPYVMQRVPPLCARLQPPCHTIQLETTQKWADAIRNTEGTWKERSRTTKAPAKYPASDHSSTSGWSSNHLHWCMHYSTRMRLVTKTAERNDATNRLLVKESVGAREETSLDTQRVSGSHVGYLPHLASSWKESTYCPNRRQGTQVATHNYRGHW